MSENDNTALRRERRRQERRRREQQLRIRTGALAVGAVLLIAALVRIAALKTDVASQSATAISEAAEEETAVQNAEGSQEETEISQEETEGGDAEEYVIESLPGAAGILRTEDRLYKLPLIPETEDTEQLRASLAALAGGETRVTLIAIPSAACVDRPEGLEEPDAERGALKGLFEKGSMRDKAKTAYDAIRSAYAGQTEMGENGLPVVELGQQDGNYYRTDTAITPRGAERALPAVLEALGIEKLDAKCDTIIVKNDYRGILGETAGSDLREAFSVPVPEEGMRMAVSGTEADGRSRSSASLYEESLLDSEDPFRVYFGGSALARIRIAGSEGDSLILVTDRDSVNMVPFLLPYYREITVVMPQRGLPAGAETLEQVSASRPGTDILILCAAGTVLNDETFAGFLQTGGE